MSSNPLGSPRPHAGKNCESKTRRGGSIEVERLKRLRKLVGLVGEYRSLPSTERERVTVTLKEFVSNTRESGAFFLSSAVIGCKREPMSENVDGDLLLVQPVTETILPFVDEISHPPSMSSAEFDISKSTGESSRCTSYSSDDSGQTDSELHDKLLGRIGQSITVDTEPWISSATLEDSLNDQLRLISEEELCKPITVDGSSQDDAGVNQSTTLASRAAIQEARIQDMMQHQIPIHSHSMTTLPPSTNYPRN